MRGDAAARAAARWGMQDSLSAYTAHLRASGLAPRTIRLRIDHARTIAALPQPVTLRDLETWMHPPDVTYAPETLHSRRASARRWCAWLHATGRAGADPSVELAPVRVPPAAPRRIPDTAVAAALRTAPPRERAAILLARYACLRLAELTTLHTSARHGDRLRVRGKGGRVRDVYLHPDVVAALVVLERAQGPGWYFPGRFSGHMHPDAMHKVIRRATGWNPHSLRHAGATAAYARTLDLRAVQAMLGHASLATTQRYLGVSEDALRAVAAGVQLAA